MLTANGKALLKWTGGGYSFPDFRFKSINGEDFTTNSSTYATIRVNASLHVGTGSDTPTSADYHLTNKDANLTVIAQSSTINNSGVYSEDYIAIFTKTYRNNTDSDVIVTEIGVESNDGTNYALMARDVFDPVTIAPGEAYTFSMYIG